MEKEKIEWTARDYAAKATPSYCNGDFDKYAIADAFDNGAQWRINSVWHDEKEMPDKEELVFCEICHNGEKAYLPLQWKADGKMTVEIPFLPDCKVTRWAYLADLLPEKRKEAEP